MYRRALAIDPDDVDDLCNYVNALENKGERDEAIEMFRRALAIDPDDVNALCNFGLVLKKIGDRDEAVEIFRRALALDPNHEYIVKHLTHYISHT